VAVCELSFATGEPDYTLFVDAKALGTVEAKPAGVTLTSVEEQSAKYVAGVPFGLPAWKSPLAFCYESTGAETFFTNRLDPQPRSRRVFSFHRPETLLAWVQQEKQLSQRLQEFPALTQGNLWPAQFEAIKNLEVSLIAGRPRALIQKRADLDEFVTCYNPKNRHKRTESERFKPFTYDELTKRDKVNLDIFWLKDDALEESANLPAPEIIAQEISDDLEAALEQFATIAEDLKG
jgi:hypothetical protein